MDVINDPDVEAVSRDISRLQPQPYPPAPQPDPYALHHPAPLHGQVWICSPSLFHADQIKACAAAGKHVFCEKPIATDILETIEACGGRREGGWQGVAGGGRGGRGGAVLVCAAP